MSPPSRPIGDVQAAGAVVIRKDAVLLVHRPRYGDWSFPKGKLDRGELAPVAAVREVARGDRRADPARHAAEPQRYPSGDRMKTVSYWHGRVVGDHSVDGYLVNDEIDEVAWVPLRKAKQRLSYTFDQATLDEALATEWRTRAFVVVRHAPGPRPQVLAQGRPAPPADQPAGKRRRAAGSAAGRLRADPAGHLQQRPLRADRWRRTPLRAAGRSRRPTRSARRTRPPSRSPRSSTSCCTARSARRSARTARAAVGARRARRGDRQAGPGRAGRGAPPQGQVAASSVQSAGVRALTSSRTPSTNGQSAFTLRSPSPTEPVTSAPYVHGVRAVSGSRRTRHEHRRHEVNTTSIRRPPRPRGGRPRAGLSVTACGAGNESEAGGGDGGGDAVTLDGGGATSQAKAQGVWRANYQDESGNTVNYEEVGSGTGRENFNSGAYVFAGSDSYMNDDEGELSAAEENCGSDPIEVPAYVSPIAVAFNVEGVDSLNMTAETIANVFNGTITKWNDDAIAADNEGVDLPDTAIAIIHRSDDSGTTTNFTDYLFKASDGAWATEADGLWPEDLTVVRASRAPPVSSAASPTPTAPSATPTTARSRTPTWASCRSAWATRFNAPVGRGCRDGRGQLAACRGSSRRRHGDRHRPHDHRRGRLPAAPHVVPDRLPDLRRRGDRRPRSRTTSPTSSRPRASRPRPTRPAPRRSTPSLQEEAAGIVDKISAS